MKFKLFLLAFFVNCYGAQGPLPKISIKPLAPTSGNKLSEANLTEFKNLVDQLAASKIPEIAQFYKTLQEAYVKVAQQKIYLTELNIKLNSLIAQMEEEKNREIQFESPSFGQISLGQFAQLLKESSFMKELSRVISLLGISQQTINYFNDIINALPAGKNAPLEVNTIKNQLLILNQRVQEKDIDLEELLLRLKAMAKSIEDTPAYAKVSFENPLYGRLTLDQFSKIILGSLIDHITNKVGLARGRPLPSIPTPKPRVPQEKAPVSQPSASLSEATGAAPEATAPHGLENVGNSCFMNASLQNIYALDNLSTELLKRLNTNYYPLNSFAQEYINFINAMRTLPNKVLEPRALCMRGWQRMHFPPLSQQDNDEFINFLLVDLFKDNDPIRKLLEIQLQTFLDGKPSVANPGSTPKVAELLLSIPANKPTLNANLAEYFAVEKGVEYGKPAVPGGPLPKVDKQEKIVSTSQYLIIHLKRNIPKINPKTGQPMFDAKDQMIMEKITTPISFPLVNLDLNPYAIPGIRLPLYRLKGFVVHAGSARGGHYTGYVRYGDKWYFVNDSHVGQVSPQLMQKIADRGFGTDEGQTPTTLFYERM